MMCDNKADGGLDVCDWVLSPEIREYLRANHIFSMQEKVDIVHSGCRPSRLCPDRRDALPERQHWQCGRRV